jgi:hypothetical protein
MDPGPDNVQQFVAAQGAWHDACAGAPAAPSRADAAREYLRAIDAYLVDLRAQGRQIPHRLDEVAATLRAVYGDRPKDVTAAGP